MVSAGDSGTVEAKPKRTRNAQEVLAAVAVALIAFWAPSTDTGLILRVLSAAAALAALLVATIGLELFEDYSATNQAKKANPFEVKIQKVELPTAPPGGVAAAASKMDEYLDGFPLSRSSDIKPIESGFQVLTDGQKLRARVIGGFANGWETGGKDWLEQRDLWMQAVAAAPRAAAARELNWMGIGALEPAGPPSITSKEVGFCVRVDGIVSKPELNGKMGAVVKGPGDNGRIGVRLEGTREPMSLNEKNLYPLAAFDALGVSIPCIRAFRANFAELLKGLTAAEAATSVMMPLLAVARGSLASSLTRLDKRDEAGRLLAAPATAFLCSADTDSIEDVFDAAEAHAAKQDKPEEVYVWLHPFCFDHHAEAMPMLWWATNFKQARERTRPCPLPPAPCPLPPAPCPLPPAPCPLPPAPCPRPRPGSRPCP
jgi:hypothetical protein